jgi:hypothetical protein
MELLLNLAWLLLAVPAWWLWCGRKPARKVSSLHCLLALGCILVVLFPVVSATDDLRAMRAEMEESPDGKRSVRQAGDEKPSAWRWENPPALAVVANSLSVCIQGWQPLPTQHLPVLAAPAVGRPGRAPPRSFPL